jgi:hypothetical protein
VLEILTESCKLLSKDRWSYIRCIDGRIKEERLSP